MFNGTTIDDLIKTVEQTEMTVRTHYLMGALVADVEEYPEFSTCVYQWRGTEQAIAGVA